MTRSSVTPKSLTSAMSHDVLSHDVLSHDVLSHDTVSHYIAAAILHQRGKFLLELRSNCPGKHYPNYWGMCGGHIEAGESPKAALERELSEEIGYRQPALQRIGDYLDVTIMAGVKCFAYYGELDIDVSHLVRSEETQDLALFTRAEIVSGHKFSQRLRKNMPIVPFYHRILLDFIHAKAPLD